MPLLGHSIVCSDLAASFTVPARGFRAQTHRISDSISLAANTINRLTGEGRDQTYSAAVLT
jgi:hypothetical protein